MEIKNTVTEDRDVATCKSKKLNEAFSWMEMPKYLFKSDKPCNTLEFLGNTADKEKTYSKFHFKEVSSNNYYTLKTEFSEFGWNGKYEGVWAWVSNTKAYPNTPINGYWTISAECDRAFNNSRCVSPIESIDYEACDEPETTHHMIGKWRLGYNHGLGRMFDRYYVSVLFYSGDDCVYRCITCSKEEDPYAKHTVSKQWFVTSGRKWSDVTKDNGDPYPYIVDGLIQTGEVTLVTGPKYCGKSHLIAQLCACVSNGTDFLGYITNPNDVVHINCDMNGKMFNRLYCHVKDYYGNDLPIDSLGVDMEKEMTAGMTPRDFIRYIANYCEQNKKVKLITIDSIYPIEGICSKGIAGRFIMSLKNIARDYKVAIVYSYTSNTCCNTARDLAYDCADHGLHAEMPQVLMGIIPDPDDSETFYINVENGFDVRDMLKCKKNTETQYCFDVLENVNPYSVDFYSYIEYEEYDCFD